MDNNNQVQNQTEVKKQSPYKGIEDPAIRAQYEKEYGMINVRLLVSIILIVLCSSAYVFIISDTFDTIKINKEDNTSEEVKEETKQEDDLEIDANSLVLTDETKPSNGNFICDASYKIENLDYEASSLKVPYININSDDANKVNDEIKDNYKKWALESAKYKKKYQDAKLSSQSIIKAKYEIYNYQNILSVVLCYTYRQGGMEANDYYSYSFNTSKESLLATSNEELINLIESEKDSNNTIANSNEDNFGKLITYQEVLAKLNLSYELVDTYYKEILTTYSNDTSDTIEKTLLEYQTQYNDGKLNAFINNKGELNIISKIYTSTYEKGTYRIFKFDGEKFEAAQFGATPLKEKDDKKENELLGIINQ